MSSSDLVANGKNLAKSAVFVQLLVASVMVVLTTLLGSYDEGLAVILGCAASIIPNGIFAFFAFRYAGAQHMVAVHKSMMQGMRVKLAITIMIFSVALIVFNAQPVFLFSAHAVSILSHSLALFWLSR